MSKRFFRTLACAVAVGSAPGLAWAAAEVRKPCPAEPTDMPIEYGDLVSCEISPVGDMDLFRFEGQAGERVVVVGNRQQADGQACIELRGPAPGESVVVGGCTSYVTSSARLDTVLPASGLFTLRVFEQGNDQVLLYGLTLERVTPPSPTALDVCRNCTVTDQIDPVGDLDFFSFAGRAGDDVIIQVTKQAGGNACQELWGPTGEPVAGACSSYVTPVTRLDLRLKQDGLYTILVFEQGIDQTLDYTVYFECFGVCPLGLSDLALTLSDSPDPVIGSTPLTYTLAVSNTGPVAASSLSVSHTLPAGVAFDSASGSGWTCGHSSGTVTCTRPTLAVGAAPDITVQVTPGSAATVLPSSASVSAAEPDPYPANNSDTATTTVVSPAMDFYTVTPCRVFDTREVSGPTLGAPLNCGTAQSFTVAGKCGVPGSATAVSLNLTGTGSTAQGNLRLFAAGTPAPLVSSLNYVAGQTRANNAVAPLGDGGQVSVLCSPSGTTHVVLDVNGYFQ